MILALLMIAGMIFFSYFFQFFSPKVAGKKKPF
jgi:hypothetical protein